MSIKQKARPAGRSRYPASLPDFRNLGVVLRTVVLVNALGLAAVLVRNGQIEALFGEFLDMAVRVEFPLILSVAALFLLKPLLHRLPYAGGMAVVMLLVAGVALSFTRSLGEFGAVIFIAGNIAWKTEVTSLMIFVRLQEFDYPAASAIASVILGASLLLLFSINTLQSRFGRRVVGH